jgi:flagellin-specific chaperone FliS
LEDQEITPNFNFDNDAAIEAIVPALISIFSERPQDAKNAALAITIIQTLLYENALITDAVMDKVTVVVIDYIQDYLIGDYGTGFGPEFLERFKELTANFFEHIGTQLSSVLKALGRDLSNKMDTGNVSEAVHSLQRIEFSLSILNLEKVEEVSSLLLPILSRILKGVQKLSKNMSEPKNTIPALNLAILILTTLKNDKVTIEVEETELAENVEIFNKFFADLCSCIINDYEDSALSELDESNKTPDPPSSALLQTLRQACKILFQVQKYANADNMGESPQWLQKLLKCCKSNHISVSLISTETFQKFILKNTVKEGGPYYQIKSIIYCGQKDKAPLNKIDYLSSLEDKKHDRHNEHCYDIIVRLWSFLEDEQSNEDTVELLKTFDISMAGIVSDVISKDLASNKTDQKVKAINKFSTYWKLTSTVYPNYVAFPDCISLFKMLEYLEDEIPSIRLASKSWLSISTTNF